MCVGGQRREEVAFVSGSKIQESELTQRSPLYFPPNAGIPSPKLP
jgi:hypothetical protein